MTTKHTPGPWTVETGNFYVSVRAPSRMIGDTRIIGGKPDDENHANARLIAAAPDMLQALETIALHAPSLDAAGIREYCDAVLAKARGEVA